jgi:hypothetical protein
LGETFVYVLAKISEFSNTRRDKGKMRKEGESWREMEEKQTKTKQAPVL